MTSGSESQIDGSVETLGGGTGAGLTRKVEIPAGGFGALIITAPR